MRQLGSYYKWCQNYVPQEQSSELLPLKPVKTSPMNILKCFMIIRNFTQYLPKSKQIMIIKNTSNVLWVFPLGCQATYVTMYIFVYNFV